MGWYLDGVRYRGKEQLLLLIMHLFWHMATYRAPVRGNDMNQRKMSSGEQLQRIFAVRTLCISILSVRPVVTVLCGHNPVYSRLL